MKIAIHHRPGSFSDRWIEYCKLNGIEYKIVNAYNNDIVKQVSDCDAFMWHHHQSLMTDTLFANQLIYSLEKKGKTCFPNFQTTWHFDDKLGQKYLLESICAPLVPSYVFYTKEDALNWIRNTVFPKVFKLRGGAGSVNVKLVHTPKEAKKIINKAFGKGFATVSFSALFSENYRLYKTRKVSLLSMIKTLVAYYIKPSAYHRFCAPERGYVYFQEFIPNNNYDIRVCIVNNRAFALKRLVRKGDFRASGSGDIIYDKNQIDEQCVKIAFQVNKKLEMQSVAFDFVFGNTGNPMIVEISYGFATGAYDSCEGWWDQDMNWHSGTHFNFCGWMVEDIISKSYDTTLQNKE